MPNPPKQSVMRIVGDDILLVKEKTFEHGVYRYNFFKLFNNEPIFKEWFFRIEESKYGWWIVHPQYGTFNLVNPLEGKWMLEKHALWVGSKWREIGEKYAIEVAQKRTEKGKEGVYHTFINSDGTQNMPWIEESKMEFLRNLLKKPDEHEWESGMEYLTDFEEEVFSKLNRKA